MTFRHAAKIDCDTNDIIGPPKIFFENYSGDVGQLGCKTWNLRWEFLLGVGV